MRKITKVRWGRIYAHAYKAGFTLHSNEDGTYNLFDIKMKYYAERNRSKDDVIRIVQDNLSLMSYVSTSR